MRKSRDGMLKAMQHTILEFKARCEDHNRIREILKRKNARLVGIDRQIDTYFLVPHGRLKLRQGEIENSLIFYARADDSGTKLSEVTMSKVPPNSEIKAVLAEALGVKVTVDKRREIYFIDNVKIHLDEVAGLGAFLEVEAIGQSEDREHLQRQCDQFVHEFGVKREDFVARSYSDLLLET
jgi:predicted adenylyl cyclase CyaB